MSSRQATASPQGLSIGKSHTFSLRYPCPELLMDIGRRGEDYLALSVHNAAQRFEPLPLVQSEAVAIHSGRLEQSTFNIFSISEAPKTDIAGTTVDTVDSLLDRHPPDGRFKMDMSRTAGYVGQTTPKIVTYRGPSSVNFHWIPPQTIDKIYIERATHFRLPGGPCNDVTLKYDMCLKDFMSMRPTSACVRDIQDLLYCRSDHADRQVRSQLAIERPGLQIQDCETVWRSKRMPLYKRFENDVAQGWQSRSPSSLSTQNPATAAATSTIRRSIKPWS